MGAGLRSRETRCLKEWVWEMVGQQAVQAEHSWMTKVTEPSVLTPVVWVDADPYLESHESDMDPLGMFCGSA